MENFAWLRWSFVTACLFPAFPTASYAVTHQTAGTLAERVTAVLEEQARAWNAGDIEAFMEHYWKSDQLTFSSGGTTTRGWSATLASYQRRYPNRDAMGRLRFDYLEVIPLGDHAALMLGQWHLARTGEQLDGNFSLVFRQLDGRWLIIHDHTSRLRDDQEN